MPRPFPSRWRVLRFAVPTLLLTACAADPPTGPDHPTPPGNASISAGDVTLEVLPSTGYQVYARAVSANGAIFGTGQLVEGGRSQPFVWTPPYVNAPVHLTPEDAGASAFAAFFPEGVNSSAHATGSVASAATYWTPDPGAAGGWRYDHVDMGPYAYYALTGINDAGEFVGAGRGAIVQALYWSSASVSPEALPAPTNLPGAVRHLEANAISNTGIIVGEIRFDQPVNKKQVTQVRRAIVWRGAPGAWTAELLPGAGEVAYSVNDNGRIAGNAGSAALLWVPNANGTYTQTPITVSSSQGALSMVDRCDRVIGYASGSTAVQRRPWVWANGALTYLPVPANHGGEAAGIVTPAGERGVIVGEGRPRNGPRISLRWTIPGCGD